MTLLGGAEHQGLVDGAQSLHFGFGCLQSGLELLGGHLKILDVSGGCKGLLSDKKVRADERLVLTTIKQGNFARLLVGHGESILEPAVAIPQLISPPLFRLDALATNGLAAHIGVASGSSDGRLEVGVVLVVVAVLVLGRPPANRGLWASDGSSDGVVAVGAGHRGGEGRRVAAASSTEPAGLHAVRGHLAGAQVVERRGRNAGVCGSERTSRGGSCIRRRVGVVAEVVVHVRRVKVEQRRPVGD